MKITIAQLNPVVGDIAGNIAKAREAIVEAVDKSSDLVVFPELFLVGYPPKDMLEQEWFIDRIRQGLDELGRLSRDYPDIGILLGAPMEATLPVGKRLHNSAVLFHDGRLTQRQDKSLLPTYDVFDEARYFAPAANINIIPFKDELLGVSICEDAWNTAELWPNGPAYNLDPIDSLAQQGASILINLSGSPFRVGKESARYKMIQGHVGKHRLGFVFVNLVGGNDELIFDGNSMYVGPDGALVAACPAFQECVMTFDTTDNPLPGDYKPADAISSVYEALTLGLKDYLAKCGFNKAVIGLSGGIDSAVTCCLAKEALGAANVLGISMPSVYSSTGSIEDSKRLAANLGVDFKIIPISNIFDAYLDMLKTQMPGQESDETEENIQARIRGNILMAFSNKYGYLVLSTGNKSELAVGYCTLYGDMSGGLGVISDVPKTMVYKLAEHINRETQVIPQEIIDKAPSAELRPGQTDQDTLPPYPVLDEILNLYIEGGESAESIVGKGFNGKTVEWVINAVDRNEYKRNQAAPGLKVTAKAFGVGRRMPIAAKYHD